jgi:hypothetical protein
LLFFGIQAGDTKFQLILSGKIISAEFRNAGQTITGENKEIERDNINAN